MENKICTSMMGREIEEINFLQEIENAMIEIEENGYNFTEFELSLCAIIQGRLSLLLSRMRAWEKSQLMDEEL